MEAADAQVMIVDRQVSGTPVLEYYLRLARHSKLLVAAVVGTALILGLIITLLATPLYRASTRVEISRIEENVTKVEGVAVDDAIRDKQYYQTQYELLVARSLAERVARALNLANDPAFLSAFGIERGEGGISQDVVLAALLNNVEISPVQSSSLVDIRFVSPDGAVSAKIANAWAQQFIASNLDRRFGATVEARKFLEQRLAQLRERLQNAERELITYGANKDLFTIPQPGSSSEGGPPPTLVAVDLQALNAELTRATADRIMAQSALQAGGNAATLESNNALTGLRQTRATAAAQLAELRSKFGEDYPQIKALSAQIGELDRAIGQENSRAKSGDRSRYEQALARERQLQSRVNQLRSRFVDQRRDSVQYNILQREVDTNQALYQALLQRYREIGVADVGENNISIVDPAEVPGVPFSPSPVRNLAAALILGLIAAAAAIVIREQLNQTVRDPADVTEKLGISVLGNVPKLTGDPVEELTTRFSDVNESYFSLYSAISASHPGGFPQTLMLTSARAGEGKSISSVALAYMVARQGRKVLLIDADLRNSGMKKYIDVEAAGGLSQLLQGETDWRPMIRSGAAVGDFSILSAGRKSALATELLSSERVPQLLDELARDFDTIILDGPPVLGLADAPLLSASVEAVLLVIEANAGKWRYIANAISRLRRSQARIIGAVVTKLDTRNADYGYGEGYGYGYGYGARSEEPNEQAA